MNMFLQGYPLLTLKGVFMSMWLDGPHLLQVPSLASGLSACTFHLFYNPDALAPLVTLQSALTLLGNSTLCFAAFRISRWKSSAAAAAPIANDLTVSTQPVPPTS